MPIDLDIAIGAELEPVEFSWTSSDIQLYHLGLGAGADPMDPRELRYLLDGTPQVLPTFGNVAQSFHLTTPPEVKFPGIDIELSRVLHASEGISAPGPIPATGTGVAVTRFTEIWDKGKAAVIWSETTVTDPAGALLWTQKRSIFARGEGGFGGDRGPSTSAETPDRAPDLELDIPTLGQQALLYRLCGDRNPLHSDPGFAALDLKARLSSESLVAAAQALQLIVFELFQIEQRIVRAARGAELMAIVMEQFPR
ncbi:MAG TPA: MaoC/PaaZ C-terminal domain-containing protein, partial [Mycolicibacterium fallax]|nr:MaoC/PaaZ C-terminal domain-containing protein [Mycolicibacterium fallax]